MKDINWLLLSQHVGDRHPAVSEQLRKQTTADILIHGNTPSTSRGKTVGKSKRGTWIVSQTIGLSVNQAAKGKAIGIRRCILIISVCPVCQCSQSSQRAAFQNNLQVESNTANTLVKDVLLKSAAISRWMAK